MAGTEAFSIIKLVSGLPKGKTIGKSIAVGFWLLVFALVLYGGWMLYKKVMQRTEDYHAETINKVDYNIAPSQPIFGCNRFVIQNPKALEPLIRIGTDKKK